MSHSNDPETLLGFENLCVRARNKASVCIGVNEVSLRVADVSPESEHFRVKQQVWRKILGPNHRVEAQINAGCHVLPSLTFEGMHRRGGSNYHQSFEDLSIGGRSANHFISFSKFLMRR